MKFLSKLWTKKVECKSCKGKGYIEYNPLVPQNKRCVDCNGDGYVRQ